MLSAHRTLPNKNYESSLFTMARKVCIKNVPDAKIEQPTDVLVNITTTNICGSDRHMYEGRTDKEEGRVMGYENLGQVIELAKPPVKVQERIL